MLLLFLDLLCIVRKSTHIYIQTCVSRSGLNNSITGLEDAISLCLLHHTQANAVLHRSTGVKKLTLGHYIPQRSRAYNRGEELLSETVTYGVRTRVPRSWLFYRAGPWECCPPSRGRCSGFSHSHLDPCGGYKGDSRETAMGNRNVITVIDSPTHTIGTAVIQPRGIKMSLLVRILGGQL